MTEIVSGADRALVASDRAATRLAPSGFDHGYGAACSMGVGCDEAGVCYAAAHGEPERCPMQDVCRALEEAIDLLDDCEIAHPLRWENALARARATQSTGDPQ